MMELLGWIFLFIVIALIVGYFTGEVTFSRVTRDDINDTDGDNDAQN